MDEEKALETVIQLEEKNENEESDNVTGKLKSTKSTSYADTLVPSRGDSVRSRRFSNMFAARKTVAQGMMDIALITANANQLRYVLDYTQESSTFYTVVILIIISMVLQIIVGILLIFKGRYDFRGEKPERARCLKNCVVFGIFLITIINVFIAAFNGASSSSTAAKQ